MCVSGSIRTAKCFQLTRRNSDPHLLGNQNEPEIKRSFLLHRMLILLLFGIAGARKKNTNLPCSTIVVEQFTTHSPCALRSDTSMCSFRNQVYRFISVHQKREMVRMKMKYISISAEEGIVAAAKAVIFDTNVLACPICKRCIRSSTAGQSQNQTNGSHSKLLILSWMVRRSMGFLILL